MPATTPPAPGAVARRGALLQVAEMKWPNFGYHCESDEHPIN
jgi:hypothetical protein